MIYDIYMIYDIVLHELALYKSTIGPLTNYQLWDEKYDTNRDLIHNYNTKKLCFFEISKSMSILFLQSSACSS